MSINGEIGEDSYGESHVTLQNRSKVSILILNTVDSVCVCYSGFSVYLFDYWCWMCVYMGIFFGLESGFDEGDVVEASCSNQTDLVQACW